MKITKQQLKQIIKEEMQSLFDEHYKISYRGLGTVRERAAEKRRVKCMEKLGYMEYELRDDPAKEEKLTKCIARLIDDDKAAGREEYSTYGDLARRGNW